MVNEVLIGKGYSGVVLKSCSISLIIAIIATWIAKEILVKN